MPVAWIGLHIAMQSKKNKATSQYVVSVTLCHTFPEWALWQNVDTAAVEYIEYNAPAEW